MSKERESPYLVTQRNAEFPGTYNESNYLNEAVLDEEMKIIGDNLRGSSQGLERLPLESKAEGMIWERLGRRLLEIEKGYGEPITRGTTLMDAHERFALFGGIALLHRDTLSRMVSFADKRGLASGLGEFAKWDGFLTESDILVRIAGLSILDVEDLDLKKPGALGRGFRFMAESSFMRVEMSHDQLVGLNQQPQIFDQFPNFCKMALESSSGAIMAAVNLNPHELRKVTGKSKGVSREALIRFEKFWSKIQNITNGIYETLLNPNSEEFDEISKQLRLYQEKDSRTSRIVALHLTSLSNAGHIYHLYRTASKFVNEGKEIEFYSKLMLFIKEYVQAESPEEGILTSDIVPSIFDNNIEIDRDEMEIKVEEYDGLINDSFKKVSTCEYAIDPDSVLVPNLIPPQKIHITFNKAKPQEFKIMLGYENGMGENISLKLEGGVKGEDRFSWSFIEPSSESEELFNLHKTLLLFVHGVLVEVNKKATEQHERRNASRVVVSAPSKRTKKGEYIPDTWRKGDKVEARQGTTPIQEVLAKEPTGKEVPGIFSKITPGEDVNLDSLMANLSSVDRDLVRSDINEYNVRGVGKFYRLRAPGSDGEPLYVLRVRVITRGDARVLLHEVESEQGSRRFEIIDIDYRKDIYRRHKI